MDAQAYLAARSPLVEERLEALLPKADEPPATLHAAMRHLVFPGGKRLRPVLAMAAAEALGSSARVALPMAAAVELVHSYSLIHDDLPCMDDDALRRGRPTVHVAYGESTALLAGDALLALAFEALTPSEVDPGPAARAVRELARTAGSLHLVGGQVDDLALEHADPASVRAAQIESVHVRKAAALIATSIVGGALLAGASERELERLRAFGLDLGIAFQIADDVLDRDEDAACSLVRAQGLEPARARAAELLQRALRRIEDLGDKAQPLRELAHFAARRDG